MKTPKTISEKIISEHTGGKSVIAGEFVVANIDLAMAQDGTGPLTIQEIKNLLKVNWPILKKQYFLLIILHQVAEKNFLMHIKLYANLQKKMVQFYQKLAKEFVISYLWNLM